MRYLLDSNILIALGLDADEAIVNRAAQCDADEMVTSAVAFAEVSASSSQHRPIVRLEAPTAVNAGMRTMEFALS